MRINKKGSLIALLLAVCVLAFASLAAAADKAPVLRMATTTSTDDTGLLDYLAPICLKDTGIDVQWVAVGTGKALEFGRNGDVDVVLTHAPSQEDKFEAEGYGVDRRKVMYNDFVLIGPANDPAGVKGKPVIEAIATIAEKQQKLVSRADKSGTHTAELKLLDKAGVKDMLVDIGGEIVCAGLNPGGNPWTIGVDRPVDGNNVSGADLKGILQAGPDKCGVVTSGNYRKFYMKDGRKYAHTVDPLTGYPVSHSLLSATVIAPTAAMADALATYCMVIGEEKAAAYIEGRDDIGGYLIYQDEDGRMRTWKSSGFRLLRD